MTSFFIELPQACSAAEVFGNRYQVRRSDPTAHAGSFTLCAEAS